MKEDIYLTLDTLRKKALLLIAAGGLAVLLGVLLMFGLRMGPLGLAIVLVGAVPLLFGYKTYSKYEQGYKHGLVETALRSVFTDLDFEPERGFDEEFLKNTGMIDMGNRYSSDDYIYGSYEDVRFERSDICIQQVTSTGKTTTVVTLFEGPWMVFDFNKPFRCDLQVAEKGFGSNRSHTGIFGLGGYMEKIQTESEAFSSRFNVYAEDDHEAFYILTPHMMERITALSEHSNGKLMLCFIKKRLHVAVNNGENAFEPSLFSPPDKKAAAGILDEIREITSFVTQLNLSSELYMMKERD
ncbi:MAG: DUF3137 domain-containing protein [Clostridiaceae bacterium]|nr:DUF3137 domain-containing protein [Clostridiaceae bacterium]